MKLFEKLFEEDLYGWSIWDRIMQWVKPIFWFAMFWVSLWWADSVNMGKEWLFLLWSAFMFFLGTIHGKENNENN